jgi:hypothetical protein
VLLLIIVSVGTSAGPYAFLTGHFEGNIVPCCPGQPGGLVRAAYMLQTYDGGIKIDIGNFSTGAVQHDTIMLRFMDKAGYDVLGIGNKDTAMINHLKTIQTTTPIAAIGFNDIAPFVIMHTSGRKVLYTSTLTLDIDTIFSESADYYIVSTTDTSIARELLHARRAHWPGQNRIIIVAPDAIDNTVKVMPGFVTVYDFANTSEKSTAITLEGPKHGVLSLMADEFYARLMQPVLLVEVFYQGSRPPTVDSILSSLTSIYQVKTLDHDIETETDVLLARLARAFDIVPQTPLLFIPRYGLVIQSEGFSSFMTLMKQPHKVTVIAKQGCNECSRLKHVLSLVVNQFPLLEIEFTEADVDTPVAVIGTVTYPLSAVTYELLVETIKDRLWHALEDF